MGRNPCSSKEGGLNKGAWTAHEDKILSEYVKIHGEGRWRNLPKKAGLNRCGKSCRLRWLNYLRPDIKRGNISPDEEELIIRLHKLLGNRWSLIAGRLPGRTDNEIKNYWNTNLGKKIQDQQISPGGSTRKSIYVETNSVLEMSTSNTTINNNNNNSNNHSSSLPSAPTGMATHVVRTKAFKCTKVVVSNDPPSPPPCLAHNVDQFDLDKHTSSSSPDTHHLSNCYPLLLQANTLNGLSPSSFSSPTIATTTTTSQEDFSSSTDFIMNFNSTEELFLSNFLNSDLFDYNGKHCNNSFFSTSLGDDEALMFSEDFLMQSWEYY